MSTYPQDLSTEKRRTSGLSTRKNDSIRAGRNSRKSLICPRIAIRVCVCVCIRKKIFSNKTTNKQKRTKQQTNKKRIKQKKTKQTKKRKLKNKEKSKTNEEKQKKKDKKKILMIKTII